MAGNGLLAKHNEAEALKRYDLALKLQPAHVPTLVTVGEDDLQKGDAAHAADLFMLAHTASPLNVEAAIGLTEAHLMTHEPTDDDEKNLTLISAAGPGTIPSPLRQRLDFALARVMAAAGKLDKAVALLQDGVAQHGDEFMAYEGALADCYIADGQYDRAESEAWKGLGKTQKDPDALARYGEILLARGRTRDLLQRVPVVQNSRRLHVLRGGASSGQPGAGAFGDRGHPQGQQGSGVGGRAPGRGRGQERTCERGQADFEANRRAVAPSGRGLHCPRQSGINRRRGHCRCAQGGDRRHPLL